MFMSRCRRVVKPFLICTVCVLPALCALPGCWIVNANETGAADLYRFRSLTEFKQYLSRQIEAERSRSYWNAWDLAVGAPDTGGDPALPAPAPEAQEGFSTTNIQESGVDEGDVVKTDGTHLYILSDNRLHIVRAAPADEMEVLSTTDVEQSADEMYLAGDTLVVLADGYDSRARKNQIVVTVLDVTDRAAPSVVTSVEVEASLNTSRLIGSKLHMVVSLWPALPFGNVQPAVMLTDVDALIPDITVTIEGRRRRTANVVDWRDLYHPVDPDGFHITAVVTVDVDDADTAVKSTGVVANAGTVYMSTDALYLTDTDYNHAGRLRETTDVYKFDVKQDRAVPAGSAVVPGRVLNRFSLGEHDGYLRIATTTGNVWRFGEGDARNHVYVIGRDGDELAVVGKVENIAPGERIYAARFLGDRGFLVTFKKVDPLFTLDMSDPTSPRVVGELKVPGYSDYIHPLGEHHLLTIGKDALDMGDFAWYQGVQVSIFDVTDFEDPRLVDSQIVGVRGTESEALHNPHAFTYFSPAQMLAVPMMISEGHQETPSSHGTRVFGGLCLFDISAEEGIGPAARISTYPADELPQWGSGDWTRGLFIGESVYAVTRSSVQALSLSDLGGLPTELVLAD
ncbi:MAG: beta-propeller domain-containing protein [Phycisphaerae bacterium]|jgi:uncharacterized secreted protein with C-terminal beta-propeller domain